MGSYIANCSSDIDGAFSINGIGVQPTFRVCSRYRENNSVDIARDP